MSTFGAFASAVRIALAALTRSKGRSLLTGLGILIGIAAVVVVTALGTGARERVGSQIESLGSNLLFVFGQGSQRSGVRIRAGSNFGLSDDDALAIRREASAVAKVAVYAEIKPQVTSEYGNAKIAVVGVEQDYFDVRNYRVAEGRSFTSTEERFKSKVCLIGLTAQQKLFGNADPIGRYVRIGKYPFRIIGTLEPKGQSQFEDQDDRIIMPIGSWRARVMPTLGNRVQLIMVTAKSPAHIPEAERQIDAILRQLHEIAEGDPADFQIRTQAEFRESQEAILGILTALFMAVAGIALLVGGVGVMNIMLVSVTERTREIGIRMAIGAKRRDIQLQFLIEAVLLTLFGGLFGIGLAVAVIAVLTHTLEWTMRLSAEAIVAAIATSLAVGTVFGFLPAQRAARLDPIEALRHE
jgi:putative ABC transport system permease protein